MKQYTITTYLFEELPKEVQEKAFEQDQIRHDFSDLDFWDFRATLDKFADIFNIVVRWEVSAARYTFDFVNKDAHAEAIKNPLRLAAYVWNKYAPFIRKGKYYSTTGRWEDGRYKYKSRHSRVTFEMDNCPLTGVCFDNDILRPVIDCLEYRRMFDTYDDLITTCLNEFFETWRAALEYSESFGFYAEEAAVQEWEYLPTGERWQG